MKRWVLVNSHDHVGSVAPHPSSSALRDAVEPKENGNTRCLPRLSRDRIKPIITGVRIPEQVPMPKMPCEVVKRKIGSALENIERVTGVSGANEPAWLVASCVNLIFLFGAHHFKFATSAKRVPTIGEHQWILELDVTRSTDWGHEDETKVAPLITTQRPLSTNDPVEASTLISSWLQMCLSCQEGHENCLETLCGLTRTPGDVVQLPTRALYIESVTPELKVNLVDTMGIPGKYCVLSHCWGPPNNQPLRTLNGTEEEPGNIEEHRKRIPPENLPRTFKEALIITKCIGIDYLWIDSLCIIQDDPDDWDRESIIMGSLYENATLMIAASAASNSREGCCNVQRPELRTVIVPLIDNKDRILGQCQLSAMPRGEIDPELSLLNKRAWCFQERYMSRRKVFFMPGGIVWQCKAGMLDERNCIAHSSIKEHAENSWCSLLSEYTAMNLTYTSDRLRAIEGIATELKKTKRHGYRTFPLKPDIDRGPYQFGVWETSMPTELVWMHSSMPKAGREHKIPTWSWGSTEGDKRWCLDSIFVPAVETTYKALSISASGILNIHGHVGTKSHAQRIGYSSVEVPRPVQEWISLTTTNVSPEAAFFSTAAEPSVRMILDESELHRILGFGHFDERPEHDVFFSILASAKRNAEDELQDADHALPELNMFEFLYLQKQHEDRFTVGDCASPEPDIISMLSSTMRNASGPSLNGGSKFRRDRRTILPKISVNGPFSDIFSDERSKPFEPKTAVIRGSLGTPEHNAKANAEFLEEGAGVPAWQITLDEKYYYALLLKPVGDNLKRFKRVGLGLMYQAAWDSMDKALKDFEIE
ncbi:hypothetical protein GQX73_g1293 [Xylaria multiplex]|uniref:Heterokaryon incompatibility domain-containing protein n=1 Tax=Xylaria multiplex TaxID=323545 RepID=A0A7C8ITZ0_9PEZI|nr:hypothetical protein GQX73_g1293 [Xylaria multiplex]